MSFIDYIEKLKIKILAPSTVCFRNIGHFQSELRYFSWFPCFIVFKNQPRDKDGYYKTVYINNKRVKWYNIIPRHALIEVREQPKGISSILGIVLFTIGTVNITVGGVIAGLAFAAAVATAIVATTSKKKSANSSGSKSYSSTDKPYLSGAKNEILENCVPIAFGRMKQTFNFGQYTIPLVKSGYAGNRYRVYSVSGYQNARYSDFSLGDVLLSNYRSTAYNLSQANGTSTFIGWDNACTENFNNKELSFDNTQTVSQSAIAYHNKILSSATSITLTQTYNLTGIPAKADWTNKKMSITGTYVVGEEEYTTASLDIILYYSELVAVGDGSYNITKTFNINLSGNTVDEYRYTTITPNGSTRGSDEGSLLITLKSETLTAGSETSTSDVEGGVNYYKGDKNEIISQSQNDTQYCDIHFSFPQGLYKMDKETGDRQVAKIKATIQWKKYGEVNWRGVTDSGISQIYTRNLNGTIGSLSSRITRSGNNFTFKTPSNLNDADDMFYETVGLKFAEAGKYLVRVTPVSFTKDNYWVGTINVSDIIWRLEDSIAVVDSNMLPHVSQIACTFNATSQLDGEVDELNAICFPYIKNIATGELEQSRNPVDVIYYLLTDTHSNPKPMTEEQMDMASFKKARAWCEEHECKCDGIISEDIKYETIINDICENNQLYFIPNKWGKCVLRVDTNEDGRPIKTFFTADNSWDLQITRTRGRLGRTLALRCSYVDEETWSDNEITGYWYNSQCNWTPEEGLDDEYYQPEKKELNYIVNTDNVKRRIAYELEILNAKNTTATFNVSREVLDLEVLDRILVADYTRIEDGVSGTIEGLIKDEENGTILGVIINDTVQVKEDTTITIRSIDVSGNGENVNIYSLKVNEVETSKLYFNEPIEASTCIIRKSGFYNVDGQEFYHSGDLYMVGTAEILSMVISKIEEISGDDFTSKITARTY